MILDVQHDLDREQIASIYREQGVVVLRGFYDSERDIAPIQAGIAAIVRRLLAKYGVAANCTTDREWMTAGYRALIGADRRYGGEVYDAVKQIPAFLRLVADTRNAGLYSAVNAGAEPGIAAGGYGIRIDNPVEEKFRAQWHQEFPAQLRSPDGIVFWSPLLDVSAEMGPVQVLPLSHREGYLDVHEEAGEAGKTGAYALALDREAEIVARYTKAAPLLRVGDLLIMDFMTVHQSGYNVSDSPRWSMQFRYFNFADPTGVSMGWKGSFAAGADFRQVLARLKRDAAG